MISMIRAFGLLQGLWFWWTFKILRWRRLCIPGIAFPVYLRNSIFDRFTLREIFIYREYDLPWPKGMPAPKRIIDAGANIGFTSVFWANRFPEATIIALEPEPENFAQLCRNAQPYSGIRPIQKALWKYPAHIAVRDHGYGQRGWIVEETSAEDPEMIPAVSVGSLIESLRWETIDLLKIDIEGSEKMVFEAHYEEWLPKVRYLVIELHDRMIPGTSGAFFKAISQYDFSMEIKGDNLLFINNQLF